jgi:hypothetical protein
MVFLKTYFLNFGCFMAMIECDECGAEISSKAAACPMCGNPQSFFGDQRIQPVVIKQKSTIKLLIAIPFTILIALITISYIIAKDDARTGASAKRQKEATAICVDAMMSNMGTNTFGYLDKQTYENHVKENCQGYKLR